MYCGSQRSPSFKMLKSKWASQNFLLLTTCKKGTLCTKYWSSRTCMSRLVFTFLPLVHLDSTLWSLLCKLFYFYPIYEKYKLYLAIIMLLCVHRWCDMLLLDFYNDKNLNWMRLIYGDCRIDIEHVNSCPEWVWEHICRLTIRLFLEALVGFRLVTLRQNITDAKGLCD